MKDNAKKKWQGPADQCLVCWNKNVMEETGRKKTSTMAGCLAVLHNPCPDTAKVPSF